MYTVVFAVISNLSLDRKIRNNSSTVGLARTKRRLADLNGVCPGTQFAFKTQPDAFKTLAVHPILINVHGRLTTKDI